MYCFVPTSESDELIRMQNDNTAKKKRHKRKKKHTTANKMNKTFGIIGAMHALHFCYNYAEQQGKNGCANRNATYTAPSPTRWEIEF